MPYTNHDVLTAIQQDDLATVQKIIAEYQTQPSDPTILFGGGASFHGNALLFALAHARCVQSYSLAIVKALLAIRDPQGQPVLDLNALSHEPRRNPHERLTVMFYVLQSAVEAPLRVQLLNALLKAVGSTGPLNLKLSAGMVSPLHQSVFLEDVACFQLLSKHQNPDGSAFFDLNRLLQPSNKTLLEIASRSSMPAMIEAIRQAGGRTRQELVCQQAAGQRTLRSAAIMPFDMVPMAIIAQEVAAAAEKVTTPDDIAPCQKSSNVLPSISALGSAEKVFELMIHSRINGPTPL